MAGSGRLGLASKIGGKFAPETGGRCEVESPAAPPLYCEKRS